jgi:hypothetical protein
MSDLLQFRLLKYVARATAHWRPQWAPVFTFNTCLAAFLSSDSICFRRCWPTARAICGAGRWTPISIAVTAESLPFADSNFDVVFDVGRINFFQDRAKGNPGDDSRRQTGQSSAPCR